jgi:hypothetical protein
LAGTIQQQRSWLPGIGTLTWYTFAIPIESESKTPVVHAASLLGWGKDLPWAWPHDALQHDKGSGSQIADQYRSRGLNMLFERAQFEDGSFGLEAGVSALLDRMQTNRFKVARHLSDWVGGI